MRRSFLSITISLALLSAVAFGVGSKSTTTLRKSLPLDGVQNFQPKTRENSRYLPGRIIVKLMPGVQAAHAQSGTGIASIDAALASLSVSNVQTMFPAVHAELDRFLVVKYSSPVDAFTAAEQLSNLPEVQYAEPWFIYQTTSNPAFTPNDPSFGLQYALTKMQVVQAWDVTQGDTTVVIGIVDSGVQISHPDLSANVWHNPGEMGTDGLGRDKRTNGVDDDANSCIDDWQGWDLGGADYNNPVADNNPEPTATNNAHGTHVAGIASAATNNSTGVAGVGFKCRILAVKTAADNDTRGPGGTGYILAGFPGIMYASLMGGRL